MCFFSDQPVLQLCWRSAAPPFLFGVFTFYSLHATVADRDQEQGHPCGIQGDSHTPLSIGIMYVFTRLLPTTKYSTVDGLSIWNACPSKIQVICMMGMFACQGVSPNNHFVQHMLFGVKFNLLPHPPNLGVSADGVLLCTEAVGQTN